MKKFAWAAVLVVATAGLIGFSTLEASPRGTRTSSTVILDTGDGLGGFNVSVTTATPVLISSSAYNAGIDYRIRTFQVTGTAYSVWFGTHSSLTYGSGNGWYVLGSTGSFTTRSQGAVYGILDPLADSETATIVGPYEYQTGARVAR